MAAFRQGGLTAAAVDLSRPVAGRRDRPPRLLLPPLGDVQSISTGLRHLYGVRVLTNPINTTRPSILVPPKKNLAEHVADQAAFLETKLKPVLAAAQAGEGHVFFVDAAHFVFGTFLCYLWSFTRIFVRAASGRQRFNVLGAWNAVTHQRSPGNHDGRQH